MRIIISAIIILLLFFWKHFVSLILIEQEMAPNSLLQFPVFNLSEKKCVKNVIDEIELIVSFYLDQFSMFEVLRVLLKYQWCDTAYQILIACFFSPVELNIVLILRPLL